MKIKVFWVVTGILLASLGWPVASSACDDIEDGCLGCRDDELPACLDKFVAGICSAVPPGEYCNEARARDDLERLIIMNTGRHMSDTRALIRGEKKYYLHHPPRP
ncbi:MAG TPA: hypothetical protein VET88_14790 [Gammaproteobacteria bacterium]|nr:hypothetical protein [Gammaproteobacteria bacterium]